MFDINTILKRSIKPIRDEIKATEKAYQDAFNKVKVIIDKDLTTKREDVMQRKHDTGLALWKEVYEPYIIELKALIKAIDKFKEKDGNK